MPANASERSISRWLVGSHRCDGNIVDLVVANRHPFHSKVFSTLRAMAARLNSLLRPCCGAAGDHPRPETARCVAHSNCSRQFARQYSYWTILFSSTFAGAHAALRLLDASSVCACRSRHAPATGRAVFHHDGHQTQRIARHQFALSALELRSSTLARHIAARENTSSGTSLTPLGRGRAARQSFYRVVIRRRQTGIVRARLMWNEVDVRLTHHQAIDLTTRYPAAPSPSE